MTVFVFFLLFASQILANGPLETVLPALFSKDSLLIISDHPTIPTEEKDAFASKQTLTPNELLNQNRSYHQYDCVVLQTPMAELRKDKLPTLCSALMKKVRLAGACVIVTTAQDSPSLSLFETLAPKMPSFADLTNALDSLGIDYSTQKLSFTHNAPTEEAALAITRSLVFEKCLFQGSYDTLPPTEKNAIDTHVNAWVLASYDAEKKAFILNHTEQCFIIWR